jgi:hypothetical protein
MIQAVAKSDPINAAISVTSGAPAIAEYEASGDDAWLKANLPHGNPLKGNRSRNASVATHISGTASGHTRSREVIATPAPSSPKAGANSALSITHASSPTTLIHAMCGRKKHAAKSSPSQKPVNVLAPCQLKVATATAIGANHITS